MPVQELTPLQAQQRDNMHLLLGDEMTHRRGKKDPGQSHINTMRRMLEKQIKDTGSGRPVTLLNLNPISLKINGGMLFWEEIPACKPDQPYVVYVFRETRWTHKDNGVGLDNVHRIDPFPVVPKVLAAEYMRQYQQETDGFGGVICYMGDRDPSTIKKGEKVMVPVAGAVDGELVYEEEERDFHELLGIVRQKRNQSIMRALQQANSWYENDDERKNVNDSHRDKARMAKQEGLIPELPRWVLQDTLSTEKQPDPCPSCRVVPKTGAIICTNCEYILDVVETFRHRPSACAYDSAEMARLTPEQWKVVDAIQLERVKQRKTREPKSNG